MDTTNLEYKWIVFSRDFWDEWLSKFFSLWVSVKFLGLFFITLISTLLLVNGYLDGSNWTTAITGVYGIIFAVREMFKTNGIGALIKDKIRERMGKSSNLKM